MLVKDLIKALSEFSPEMEVSVWLPGSSVDLMGQPFYDKRLDEVRIEGNLRKGSALLHDMNEEDYILIKESLLDKMSTISNDYD